MFKKKVSKAGVQKKGLEAAEAGDGGAPFPEGPARRIPFTKAKTNNFVLKGRK